MATLTNFYHDIDIFGREKREGIALDCLNADAIKNALILFLTTKKGDYIRNPGAGGIVDFAFFKTPTEANIQKIGFILKNAINNYFVPAIELQEINVIPDYDNKILEISIVYKDLTTLVINNVSLYTNTSYAYQKFEYEEVSYTGANLLRFIILQKTGDPSKKLIYNSDDGVWYYGKFKLINLTQSDPYFDQILQAANM
jgi:hypothetical protein